ncbi:MAG: hypothetical protein QOD65_1430 [Gaiellales bacterium]|nr:hypothetical protein [Gaiellales bacterium]
MDAPTLNSLLAYVARPRSDVPVERVALIEDFADIERVDEHAVVLLSRGASAAASSYRFDVALRLARSRKVAALVLSASDAAMITPTSAAVADRSGTAILARAPEMDLAQLAVAISLELAGGAEVALRRAREAIRAIEPRRSGGTEELLRRAGAALGVALEVVHDEPATGPRAAIRVDDRVEGWVTAPPQEGDLAIGLDVVLHAAAAELGHSLAGARRAAELPILSREEVLSELLTAPSQARGPLVQRARTLGIPIDGWHVAVRLEVEDFGEAATRDDPAHYEARLRMARAALQAAGSTGDTWHSARAGLSLLLIRMDQRDPGIGAVASVTKVMDGVLPRMRSSLPTALIRCGVGSAHPGPAGLLTSATEARAAVIAGRAAGRINAVVPFDSVGLRRTLVEWYASDTAQEAVTTVLAPLLRQNGARAERLIQTLHVYLDQQSSLTRTGEILNLHRNAVRYRVTQAFRLLEIDQDNPDDLLLLQLACRARELGLASAP